MDQLQVTATFPNIASENLAEFKQVAARALESARGEPGTVQYDWFFNDDESRCVVRETYANSEAVLAHLGNTGELLGKLIELGGFQVEVFGDPSAQLMEAAAALQPSTYSYFQGK